jgi:hypothetical protein
VINVHIYLDILQKLFETISVSVESFKLVEVELFESVSGLSHSKHMNNRLVVSLDCGEEVFKG